MYVYGNSSDNKLHSRHFWPCLYHLAGAKHKRTPTNLFQDILHTLSFVYKYPQNQLIYIYAYTVALKNQSIDRMRVWPASKIMKLCLKWQVDSHCPFFEAFIFLFALTYKK